MTDDTLHPDATELELDRLRARVAELEKEREPVLRKLHAEGGSIEMEISAARWLMNRMVDAMASVFTAEGGKNYVQFEVAVQAVEREEQFVLLLQRRSGLTPHQLRQQAERERDELRAKVRTLEECLRLANEGALQAAGRIRGLEALLSRTLDNCKFWSDEFKDEVRAAIRARGSK